MKRLFAISIVVVAVGLAGTSLANASNRHHGFAYRGHGHSTHHYTHGSSWRHGYPSHSRHYDYRHGHDHRYRHPRYDSHGGYGHGGVRIVTPHFGLRIGH